MFITLNISKMSLPKTLYGFITRFMPVIIFTSAFLGIIFKQNLARKALKTIIPRNANLGTWNIGLIALSDNLTRQIEKYKPIWKWDQWIIKVLNIFAWWGGQALGSIGMHKTWSLHSLLQIRCCLTGREVERERERFTWGNSGLCHGNCIKWYTVQIDSSMSLDSRRFTASSSRDYCFILSY